MAIALDANLGTLNQDSGSTTIALTTGAAVASGGFIVVGVAFFGTSETVSTVAGGSLSWTIDKQARPIGGGNPVADYVAIASAQAPSGLASSTVITATFSASVPARIIGANSFTGVATSSPVDGTPTGATHDTSGTQVAAWNTASYAISAGSMIYAVCFTENTDTGNTPTSPAAEGWEQANLANDYMAAAVYRIEASGGSYTAGGTWGAASIWSNCAVAYLAAAGGGAEKQSFYAFRRRSVTR